MLADDLCLINNAWPCSRGNPTKAIFDYLRRFKFHLSIAHGQVRLAQRNLMFTAVALEIINWLSFPLLGILTAVLLRRKIPSKYPLFFVYVAAEFLSDVLRFAVYYSGSRQRFSHIYGVTYWTTDIITTLCAFFVIYELFLKRIFPSFPRIRFYRYLFPLGAVIIIVVAGIAATDNIHLEFLFKSLHTIGFIRAATILFFIALMAFMGRRWEKHEFAIALGMAITTCTLLAAFVVPLFPPAIRRLGHILPVIGFDVTCLVWLVYFARAGKRIESPLVEPVTPELVQDAQQTEENLKEWLAGKKSR